MKRLHVGPQDTKKDGSATMCSFDPTPCLPVATHSTTTMIKKSVAESIEIKLVVESQRTSRQGGPQNFWGLFHRLLELSFP